MTKYIAVDRHYDEDDSIYVFDDIEDDSIYVFDDIFRIHQQYAIWNVTVYEVEFLDYTLAHKVYHDSYSTKYSNLVVGKMLLQENITELGLLVIKDELGRVVYYYNKLNGSTRTFKYYND